MQIFVTDFDFSPLRTRRVASTFMRKCAKPQKNPGPKLQKKEHQKKLVPFVFQWSRLLVAKLRLGLHRKAN